MTRDFEVSPSEGPPREEAAETTRAGRSGRPGKPLVDHLLDGTWRAARHAPLLEAELLPDAPPVAAEYATPRVVEAWRAVVDAQQAYRASETGTGKRNAAALVQPRMRAFLELVDDAALPPLEDQMDGLRELREAAGWYRREEHPAA